MDNSNDNTSVRGMNSIVDAAFKKELIDERQLKSIRFESVSKGIPLDKVLVDSGIVSLSQIQKIKAEMYGYSYIDLSVLNVPSKVLNILPKQSAEKYKSIIFEATDTSVKVAMLDPLDLQTAKLIENEIKMKVEPYFADPQQIKEIIDRKYGAQIGNVLDKALEDVNSDIPTLNNIQASMDDNVEGAPVSRIINMILEYAIKHNASDIHIEPRQDKISVRYRIDGILSERLTLPSKLASSLVARIKILSNMKIDEHRIPQDNRFQVKTSEAVLDLRVSVMPSINGEKVVMRLQSDKSDVIGLDKIGMRGTAYKRYINALDKTQGIILITGPTGSGKTVTLASSLTRLNKPEVNILTLEDPVEIKIPGVTQVQVNNQVGLTFANGLRSFLRQDPDIIMVGEIRDGETANLAVQAALTGHLVLATLHTNSSSGALARLIDLGVQPFLLTSTINAIVGQRLIRKLDPECIKESNYTDKQLEIIKSGLANTLPVKTTNYKGEVIDFNSDTNNAIIYSADEDCIKSESGYSGRIGIFEVLTLSEGINSLVMNMSSSQDIHKQAVKEGMITMYQDGLIRVLEGNTTMEEILRVQSV